MHQQTQEIPIVSHSHVTNIIVTYAEKFTARVRTCHVGGCRIPHLCTATLSTACELFLPVLCRRPRSFLPSPRLASFSSGGCGGGDRSLAFTSPPGPYHFQKSCLFRQAALHPSLSFPTSFLLPLPPLKVCRTSAVLPYQHTDQKKIELRINTRLGSCNSSSESGILAVFNRSRS
jgi:hypothetical protein